MRQEGSPQKTAWEGTPVQVLASRRISPTAHWVRVERPDGFSFLAGQHATFEVATPEGVEGHLYSIACAPSRPDLEFATRLRDSAFKRAFGTLEAGDTVAVRDPSGSFVLDPRRPAVFLSGGIGITAIKAMLEHAVDDRIDQDLVLLYGNRSEEELLFGDELRRLEEKHPRLRVLHTLDEASDAWAGHRGHIDAAMVEEAASDVRGPTYYICGPPGMVRALKSLLKGLKPNARVRTEDYAGYP